MLSGVGGRGNTNRWQVLDPQKDAGDPRRPSSRRRVAPPAGAPPLVVPVPEPGPNEATTDADAVVGGAAEIDGCGETASIKGGQDRTLSPVNRPVLTGVSDVKGGQDRTVFDPDWAETPAQTPAQTPAPNARAGRNPRTPEPKEHPPAPEEGSADQSITIEETYLTDRGRRRRRRVNVNLDEIRRTLGVPGPADHAVWERIRELLVERVGESTFDIWLDAVRMVAVDTDGALVLDGPEGTRSWVRERYGRVIADCAERAGGTVRFASEAQAVAVGAR